MKLRQAAKETLFAASVTTVTTVVCFAFFVLAHALSYWTPTDRIEAHLQDAFEQRQLQLANSLPYDSDLGYHQRNDCLIFWMTIIRPEEIGEYLSAGQFVGDPNNRASYCEVMRDYLGGDAEIASHYGNYLRYLHGYRDVSVFALSLLDVPSMRVAFKTLCYGLLFLVVLSCFRKILHKGPFVDEMTRLRAWGGVGISIAFAMFYGLPYFGQSPSHAPVAWTLFTFLMFATGRDLLAMGRVAFFASMSAFGAFMAYFEYLTGGAVIGLALLLGTMALQGSRHSVPTFYAGRVVLAAFSYIGGLVLAFTLNLGLNIWYFGTEAFFRFAHALLTRMGGTAIGRGDGSGGVAEAEISSLDLIEALLNKLDFLFGGYPILTQLLFVAFIFTIAAFSVIGFINSRSATGVLRILLVLASVSVTLLWYVAFKNHSLIHSAFMVRVLVWIPAAASLMVVLVVQHLWLERPEPSSETQAGLPEGAT